MNGIGIVRVPSGMSTSTRRPSTGSLRQTLARDGGHFVAREVAVEDASPDAR